MTRDRVSRSVADRVFARDGGCIVGKLLPGRGGPCQNRNGMTVPWYGPWAYGGAWPDLTLAHVRDRGLGGRLGLRPPSTARHLVCACYGHHLKVSGAVVDRADVRDVLDDYLARMEGPEPPSSRPWERITRIRGRDRGT